MTLTQVKVKYDQKYKQQKKKKSINWTSPSFKTCVSKGINKMKRQPTEQEKIFANHTSNKDLESRIYKELLQLNNKDNSILT